MKNSEIVEHYSRLLDNVEPWRWGDHGSRESRDARFRALLGVSAGDYEPKVYMDIGCGTGQLATFIPSGDYYIGLDISPKHIERAVEKNANPRAIFFCQDFQSAGPHHFSATAHYVLASGLFQFSDAADMRQKIEWMWKMCRKAVAFNFLTRSDGTPGETHHDPIAIADFCHGLTPAIVMRTDYLHNDATVYMYRHG